VDVDPVEQRPGDPGTVPLDLGDRTGALVLGVAVKAARTALRFSFRDVGFQDA
jgi:hypothetical protein